MEPSTIKLSEAIDLGRNLIKWDQYVTLSDGRGCAMGMAMAAMGLTWGSEHELNQLWPWTVKKGRNKLSFWWDITERFCDVAHGRATLDDLTAWVREVEPKEVNVPVLREEQYEEAI